MIDALIEQLKGPIKELTREETHHLREVLTPIDVRRYEGHVLGVSLDTLTENQQDQLKEAYGIAHCHMAMLHSFSAQGKTPHDLVGYRLLTREEIREAAPHLEEGLTLRVVGVKYYEAPGAYN